MQRWAREATVAKTLEQRIKDLLPQAQITGNQKETLQLVFLYQEQKNFKAAFRWCKEVAEQNSVYKNVAQFELAWMYLNGLGMDSPNIEQALQYYEGVQKNMGGFLQNLTREWLELQPENGTDFTQASHDSKERFQKRLEGYAEAQYLKGTFFETGSQGHSQDSAQANLWFKEAATKDHTKAKQKLGQWVSAPTTNGHPPLTTQFDNTRRKPPTEDTPLVNKKPLSRWRKYCCWHCP